MGHKINPTSLRMNITETWKSKWFSKRNFAKQLTEDVKIREYLEVHLKKAGLVRIDIERLNDGGITVIIKTTKPGILIGKGGAGIEDLKKKVKTKLRIKQELKINVEEIPKSLSDSGLPLDVMKWGSTLFAIIRSRKFMSRPLQL